MISVTLDTNSIVDLEQDNEWAPYFREMLRMHKDGRIHMRIVAMSASERNPNGKHANSFDEFVKKISGIGLSDVEILKPICYWGISYWDCCVWADETMSKLEEDIHRVLFPTIEFEYAKYCKSQGLNEEDVGARKKCLNAKCDVLILWSHIWYRGDFFVTRDKHFFRKTQKPSLAKLGAKEILYPNEAVFKLR